MVAILKNGVHFIFFKWTSHFSEREGSEALVCQIWCLCHQVNGRFSNLLTINGQSLCAYVCL